MAYVFKDIEMTDMVSRLKNLDYSWIILSIALSIISHIARAYRWNILIKPLGFSLSVYRTFLAVMIGYFANLLVPRMGEVTKCAILKRTDNVPITLSLGTVVAERFLDFIVLMSLLLFTFLIEYNLLKEYLLGFFSSKASGVGENLMGIYIMGGLFFTILLVLTIYGKKIFKKLKSLSFYNKLNNFIKEMCAGLMSIRTIDNKFGFWSSTLLIWVLYYLMAYVVFFSLPQTAGLGYMAGLTILVMGGLGMAAPVQGGIGTYHALVSSVLVLYGILETDGVLFATVLHTSQTLAVLLVGGLCLLIISFNKRAVLAEDVKKETNVQQKR